jgi:hypothetical protein
MNLLRVLLLVVLAIGSSACTNEPEGPVTTAEVAIAKAKSGWASVHAKTKSRSFAPETVARFEPYAATLRDGEWYIAGTTPPGSPPSAESPEAKVRASDGLTHVEGHETD